MRLSNPNGNLKEEDIQKFESINGVALPRVYRLFLKENNGGETEPNLFFISENQGASVLDSFFGLGDIYGNLQDFIDIYDGRLPDDFIPIGNDPGGNAICVSINEDNSDNIYFWDHEEETENPNEMSNVFLLANDIEEFINNFYED
ncbi:SMI1/KNR4 family protein [Listeria rocourtiae]|uniref:SMI1/KNR4 family protein n=1 Tax=Listeria rocourtiae TaxID=647910 RepID=UPI001625395C|nr:SMI1/KNR4 family protein [Listeria rocourtiae]MBC1436124.1 SMI1/KNR4 family protein [Listeria rocourtiae]